MGLSVLTMGGHLAVGSWESSARFIKHRYGAAQGRNRRGRFSEERIARGSIHSPAGRDEVSTERPLTMHGRGLNRDAFRLEVPDGHRRARP